MFQSNLKHGFLGWVELPLKSFKAEKLRWTTIPNSSGSYIKQGDRKTYEDLVDFRKFGAKFTTKGIS